MWFIVLVGGGNKVLYLLLNGSSVLFIDSGHFRGVVTIGIEVGGEEASRYLSHVLGDNVDVGFGMSRLKIPRIRRSFETPVIF